MNTQAMRKETQGPWLDTGDISRDCNLNIYTCSILPILSHATNHPTATLTTTRTNKGL